jgi:hypothetical protein
VSKVLVVLLLAPIVWGLMCFAAFCGSRLPKWSWKRLPLALLVLVGLPGIVVAQAYWLTTIAPNGFDRGFLVYPVLTDVIPAIAIGAYVANRGDRAKKKTT